MLRPSGELLVRFNQTVAIVPWARQVLKDSYVRSNISNVVFGDFFLFLDRLLTPVSPGQISLKNYLGTEATPKRDPRKGNHPSTEHPQKTSAKRDPHNEDYHASKHPKKDLPKERPPTKGTTMLQSIPKRTSAKRDPHKGDYHASKHPRKDHLKERPPQRGLPYHKSSQKEPL